MRRTASRVLVAFFGLVSLCTAGFAADLPRPVYKAPLLSPVPVFSWTGFYIGGHVGYGWSRWTGTSTFGTDSVDGKGWLGGAQAGYNYQAGNWVFGVEGEYTWSDVKYTTPIFAGTLSLKNDYYITAAARIGYAFDRFLVYAKGGAVWSRDKWDVTDGIGGFANGNFNRTGWLLGGGLEWAFWGPVSAKLEYNYLNFGSVNENLTTGGGLTVSGNPSVKEYVHLLKLGLNYRF